MMLDLIVKYKKYIIGIALGAVAGFLYWRFVGCTSGTCPITSKWYNTTVYGALMGLLFTNSAKKKTDEKSETGEKI